MVPFARGAHSGPPDVGRKDHRALGRRERMRAAGGIVCGVTAGGAGGPEGQRNPPGGRSQISFGGESPVPPPPAAPPPTGNAVVGMGAPPPKQPQAESPPKSYGDMLAAQIEEKRAMKAAEKARNREADREDELRVQREAGQLLQEVQGEVAKQRSREQLISERQDSLSRFLAQQEQQGRAGAAKPSGGPTNHAPPPEEDHLDARRRAVPGLCGKPPTPPRSSSRGANPGAAAAGARPPSAGHRTRSTPPPRQGSAPFAMEQDTQAAPPRQAALPRAHGGLLPSRGEEAPRSGVSANIWATGANQNCGNFISDRPTSRVIQPPGGGSSLQLGW